jgi:hypothetical protein
LRASVSGGGRVSDQRKAAGVGDLPQQPPAYVDVLYA